MLHICANASKQVYRFLRCWDALYDSLKQLEGLVSNPIRFRVFKQKCLDSSVFADVEDELWRSKAPHLYDKR